MCPARGVFLDYVGILVSGVFMRDNIHVYLCTDAVIVNRDGEKGGDAVFRLSQFAALGCIFRCPVLIKRKRQRWATVGLDRDTTTRAVFLSFSGVEVCPVFVTRAPWMFLD